MADQVLPAKNSLKGWTYRVVKRTVNTRKWFEDQGQTMPPNVPDEETIYGIHEAYTDKQGKAHAITDTPIEVMGETVEELKNQLEMMKLAFDKPILDYDKIPEEGALPIGAITAKDLFKEAKTAADIILETNRTIVMGKDEVVIDCCGEKEGCKHNE